MGESGLFKSIKISPSPRGLTAAWRWFQFPFVQQILLKIPFGENNPRNIIKSSREERDDIISGISGLSIYPEPQSISEKVEVYSFLQISPDYIINIYCNNIRLVCWTYVEQLDWEDLLFCHQLFPLFPLLTRLLLPLSYPSFSSHIFLPSVFSFFLNFSLSLLSFSFIFLPAFLSFSYLSPLLSSPFPLFLSHISFFISADRIL